MTNTLYVFLTCLIAGAVLTSAVIIKNAIDDPQQVEICWRTENAKAVVVKCEPLGSMINPTKEF